MLIRKIKINNLLSFGPTFPELELRPLNVLIGPNGAGKSNLIEVISLLRAAPKALADRIRAGGGIHDWLWKGARSPVAVIDTVIKNPDGKMPLRYHLEFTESRNRLEITDERIENEKAYPDRSEPFFFYRYESNRPVLRVQGEEKGLRREDIDPQESILSQRKDPEQYPELTHLGQVFSTLQLYREWSFGRGAPARFPQPADLPNRHLQEDCLNLALVLNRSSKDLELKRQIVQRLQLLYDGIDDFHIDIQGNTVQIFLQEGDHAIPATRLSDGSLRYLCLLAILCHPEPPPLVCMEEPELGLHPDILPKLAEMLLEASERTQLVVTTHSEVLVDALTEHPETVIVCEKSDGSTTMNRLKADDLQEWLQDYRLGHLWRSGEIGGNRW